MKEKFCPDIPLKGDSFCCFNPISLDVIAKEQKMNDEREGETGKENEVEMKTTIKQ